ncbi:MAG: DUF2750 domain-containing protein, partial [Prosthecobacter sp.]|nr:DUF2750 domain-containing protein [Prosthecobacter sp.]
MKQFAKAVIDCGTLYYMKGRGGYAAVEGSLPGFTAFMPLWASQEAANSQRCGEWEKYVIRPQPVDGLRYFKDDFVMNGWAAACYIEATDEWVEVSFLTLLAAVIREKGRRRIRKGNQRWGDDTHGSRHDARPEASSMSQDLREALDRFVARAKAKNGHVSELPALAAFDTRFPGIMPAWYREVLEKSAIGDIT